MKFDHFFQTATGQLPYTYQRVFAEAPVLPDLLEAPTGSGKTATAILGWLWRRRHGSPEQRAEAGRRLVFCLPMRTLVEQTTRAARTWVEALGLTSEVGIHLLLGGSVDTTWEDQPERDLILVGTQDQLLSRALMRGYAMSRYRWPVHFALLHNDCTWVLDEVQLMGVGASTTAQLQAFRETLDVFGTTRTVWMTATLSEGRLRTVDLRRHLTRQPFVAPEPALIRRLDAPKKLLKADSQSGKKGSLGALAKEIATKHQPGSLTLVVVNRVARAQELHQLLGKEKNLEALGLVHSRFRPADRRRIQQQALDGSFQGVLVATQAIEAGVDISAKTLFTELCPWASLVQRFGRLNRAGEHTDSSALWIDLDTDDNDLCLPYEPTDLVHARQTLATLNHVSPRSLSTIPLDEETPALPVIRRKDLLELFDTEPDLAGYDIDVSRYIRITDDRDLQVAWRALGGERPPPDAPDLQRDELCSVPVYELEKLAKDHSIWRFDGRRRTWIEVDARHLYPGLAVVVDLAVGGYDANRGFTRDKNDVPTSLEQPDGPPPDADEADTLTLVSDYVTLRMHAEDTAQEMERLVATLNLATRASAEAPILVEAARWHDAGKVHPVFQAMLIEKLPADDPRRTTGPWAKSDWVHSGRSSRAFFRHELASALTWLAAGKPDLGGFIIAAHHGKIRLSLRARPGEEPPANAPSTLFAHGVRDGDELPTADLGAGLIVPAQRVSLECMTLGGGANEPSWADRMSRLLEDYGPFCLAYLETLVRVADWRASRKRAPSLEVSHG